MKKVLLWIAGTFAQIKTSIKSFFAKFNNDITKEEYQKKLKKIEDKNLQKEYKMSLNAEKHKLDKKKRIETSKLIAIYLFVLLNSIVIYSMIAMWKFVDFSYLGVLISDIAAQVLIYAIYCMKAYKAKKSEEDLKFKREKEFGTLSNVLEAGANCRESVPTSGCVDTFMSDTDALG